MTVIRRTTPLGELISHRQLINRIARAESRRSENSALEDERALAGAAEISDAPDIRAAQRESITEPGD
jgi:hypothetical protein